MTDPTEIAAFEIWNPETGKRYKIFANGHVSGFDGPHCIINRIPALTAAAQVRERATPLQDHAVSDKPTPEVMLLQARKPDGGEWIDVWPAQLSWLAKEGNEVRAIAARDRLMPIYGATEPDQGKDMLGMREGEG